MDKAERVFNSLSGFEARYEAATYALRCAAHEGARRLGELMLHDGYDAHQRAAVYRLLAQANARLQRKERLLDCATKAVALNPNSPWGWWWLAEAYHLGGYAQGEAWYASRAAVLKHELTFFTGDSENDRMRRGQIYSRLGHLYRMPFRQPEIAVAYYRKAIDEFTGLPRDWYRCEGLYMNIIYTCVQNLHDMEHAQEVVREAQRAFPGFPHYDQTRAELRRLGLDPGRAGENGHPPAWSQPGLEQGK
jgi:tetratricopeptide (TPR) repeat protein